VYYIIHYIICPASTYVHVHSVSIRLSLNQVSEMSFTFRVPRCARFFLETHSGNFGQPACPNQVSEFRVSKTVSFLFIITDALKSIVSNIINDER
jgi:hypothetical protein